VDRIQAGQGACSQGERVAVDLVSVPLVWLAQCDACGKSAVGVRDFFSCPACACSDFSHAWRHVGAEIEEEPAAWVVMFALAGAPMPEPLAAAFERWRQAVTGERELCHGCEQGQVGCRMEYPSADSDKRVPMCPACRAERGIA